MCDPRMDRNNVISIVKALKSTSSSQIQDILLKIKNNVISNDNDLKLFRDCGGLENLLPHLRKPNERTLDITLSILGNCCLDEKSCFLVGNLNTFGPLVSILKTVCRDSILGRTCRVIGNLATRYSNAEGLHNHGAIAALIDLIKSRDKNTSNATLTMAVRAIRQLWVVTERREEMLSLNAVRCVTILLIGECESAGIIKMSNPDREIEELKKSHEELITGILKCLGCFTSFYNHGCAMQIQGDGRGYQCLVALTKSFESPALKCLLNLCHVATCRPDLGTAGLVECLVEILQKYSDLALWPEGSAKALVHLSAESVNRSRLRHCGGLSLLLAAARIHPTAMHALLQYIFDDLSFQVLVNEGIISLLADKLKDHLKTMDFYHKRTDQLFEGNDKSLYSRLRAQKSSHSRNDLKEFLEDDNTIANIIVAVGSDRLDENQSEEENPQPMGKYPKRPRSESPKHLKEESQHMKMGSQYSSTVVYRQSKSSEWPNTKSSSSPTKPASPERVKQIPSYLLEYDCYGFSPDYKPGTTNKRARWDWSPQLSEASSSSANRNDYPWSSGESNPTSPCSIFEGSSDSDISGLYSPVFSELESDTEDNAVNLKPGKNDPTQFALDLDELDMDDNLSADGVGISEEEEINNLDPKLKSSNIECIFVLLFRISHGAYYGSIRELDIPNQQADVLTGGDFLNSLLDYVERCRRPLGRAARILIKVFSNALFVLNLLRHKIALRLHYMGKNSIHPNKCQQCKQVKKISRKLLNQMNTMAESSYGIGEISYQLLKGSTHMKQTLAITLPYVVRSKKPLNKYFIDCNALNILFTIISETKEYNHDCVNALVALANHLQIKDPKILETKFTAKISYSYDTILDKLPMNDIVTFELDDSSLVTIDRVFLCQNSDVFSAMLKGCFKESIEKCVRLRNVSKAALEYLITLLYHGFNNPTNNTGIIPMTDNLDTNLEALLLADRFLLEKLKDLLCSAILQFQLCPDTADKIYTWSLGDGMGFLCVESVAYLLTGKMSDLQRSQSFGNVLTLKYRDQLLDDIKSMIMRQLNESSTTKILNIFKT